MRKFLLIFFVLFISSCKTRKVSKNKMNSNKKYQKSCLSMDYRDFSTNPLPKISPNKINPIGLEIKKKLLVDTAQIEVFVSVEQKESEEFNPDFFVVSLCSELGVCISESSSSHKIIMTPPPSIYGAVQVEVVPCINSFRSKEQKFCGKMVKDIIYQEQNKSSSFYNIQKEITKLKSNLKNVALKIAVESDKYLQDTQENNKGSSFHLKQKNDEEGMFLTLAKNTTNNPYKTAELISSPSFDEAVLNSKTIQENTKEKSASFDLSGDSFFCRSQFIEDELSYEEGPKILDEKEREKILKDYKDTVNDVSQLKDKALSMDETIKSSGVRLTNIEIDEGLKQKVLSLDDALLTLSKEQIDNLDKSHILNILNSDITSSVEKKLNFVLDGIEDEKKNLLEHSKKNFFSSVEPIVTKVKSMIEQTSDLVASTTKDAKKLGQEGLQMILKQIMTLSNTISSLIEEIIVIFMIESQKAWDQVNSTLSETNKKVKKTIAWFEDPKHQIGLGVLAGSIFYFTYFKNTMFVPEKLNVQVDEGYRTEMRYNFDGLSSNVNRTNINKDQQKLVNTLSHKKSLLKGLYYGIGIGMIALSITF